MRPDHRILEARGRPDRRWSDEAERDLRMLTPWAEGKTAARN
jgi:hypothetical protein